MLIRGNLLFWGDAIFDISNKVPVYVGTVPTQIVQDVQGTKLLGRGFLPIYTLVDNYLLVDITDPTNPVITSSVYDETSLGSRFIDNGSAFAAADASGGLVIVDLSANGGMLDKARVGALFGYFFDHAFGQQTMYVAGAGGSEDYPTGGLVTFDLSSGTPVYTGQLIYQPDEAFALQVVGNIAFLGLMDSLKTVNVSDPANPVETGSLPLATSALVLSSNTLFDATGDGRIVALNVDNPNSPTTLGSISLPGPAVVLRLNGNTMFAAEGTPGMSILDVSNPAAPVQLSQVTLSTPIWDVAISGNLALLAADTGGFVVLDVSNPSQPVHLSATILDSGWLFDLFGGPQPSAISISTQNGIAYVGTANDLGVVIGFDYSQPSYPRIVSMNAFGDLIDVQVSGVGFVGNNIYVFGGLGVENDIVQADNSAGSNVINLYYAPPALDILNAAQNARKADNATAFVHPKLTRQLPKPHRRLSPAVNPNASQ